MLLASDGPRVEAIAVAVGKSLLTVRRWHRYTAKRVDGLLKDATRPSRVIKPLTPEKINQVVHMTLHEKPPNAPVEPAQHGQAGRPFLQRCPAGSGTRTA